jgi:threonine dehydratase
VQTSWIEAKVLTLKDILAARRTISNLVRRTPLEYSFLLSQRTGCELYLKLENRQVTGSFKPRGAVNKIASLSVEEKARGLVTASAGNHALGVAHAARALGDVPNTIFLPHNAPRSKAEKLREFGSELRFAGNTYEEAHHAAEEFVQAQGATYVHAYDDPVVIAGQGTAGLEIMEDLPDVDAIIVPVGGGGLSAGIAVAAKAINPEVKVIGVQPDASPAAYLSFKEGQCYESYEAGPTIADGLAGGYGIVPFTIVRNLIDEIVVVSEEAIWEAVYALLELNQLVVEGSGAAAVAPLLAGPARGYETELDLRGKKVVVVLSGGNIDAELLLRIMKARMA